MNNDSKRIVYFHDAPLEKHNGVYYSAITNDILFNRYKVIAKDVSAALRVNRVNVKPIISRIDNTNIIELENIKTFKGLLLKRRKVMRKIKQTVLDHDYIIARLPSSNGNLAIKYAKKYKKPYLIEAVACPWD